MADNNHRRLTQLKHRRKLWLNVHLWLGLGLGLFLSLLGMTGSILVFYDEIDKALNAELMQVNAPPQGEAAFKPFADIMAAANTVLPTTATIDFVTFPSDAKASYVFSYLRPALSEAHDQWHLYVNPYSAQVLGTKLIKQADDWVPRSFIEFVWQLHFAVLAGDIGTIIVGIIGTLLIFSVLTGLILWWPLTGNWRRVLTIKPRASAERFNHDLHQLAGFYSFPVLLAVLLSGVYMNLPEHFMAVVKLFSSDTKSFMDMPHASAAQGRPPIALADALSIVRSRYPEGRIDGLRPAEDEHSGHFVRIVDVPGLSAFWSERQIFVDQYSGEIIDVRDPSNRPTAGQTFVDWQWPLHSGKAFGWTGRILVFLLGLACPVLFVTGLIRWLQKRRAKSRKR